MITPRQEKEVVNFVKMWRNKRFCTCRYIKQELKLEATPRTIARALNRNGYHWCQVSKKMPLTHQAAGAEKEVGESFPAQRPHLVDPEHPPDF